MQDLLIVSLITSLIVFIMFGLRGLGYMLIDVLKDWSKSSRDKYREQIRLELYDVVVKDIYKEKEELQKKLKEQNTSLILNKKRIDQLDKEIELLKFKHATYCMVSKLSIDDFVTSWHLRYALERHLQGKK